MHLGKEFLLPLIIILSAFLIITGCQEGATPMADAANSISEEHYAQHIATLSSDEFEGRSPSSAGEDKTLTYLESEFKALGLQPGNGDRYLQEVPLVKFRSDYDPALRIRGNEQSLDLTYKDAFMAVTRRMVASVALNQSELVFAGYGIIAPEYDWNDYQDIDVRGKTVIVLVNDPGYATEDADLFNGKAMTYYGRWTYKYAEAARQGAEGVIIVHETGPAGYPWEVVQNSWSGPQFYLEATDKNRSRGAIEGWITTEAAEEVFAAAGLNFEEQKQNALEENFQANALGLDASFSIRNEIRNSRSHNFLAVWPGSERSDEYIIYTAHWDHFGIDSTREGDQIFNGARDNATGVAALLEIARAFTRLPERQQRSILFLSVTAEERGLLGSKYYGTHPVYPLTKTVAAINMDALNIWGRTRDVTVVGYGNSELDEYVQAAAEEQGRYVRPDPEPEKGGYYRSDHFSFARQGVPALAADHGVDHVEKGEDWMREEMDAWIEDNYHKPSDEYRPDEWDLSGALEDIRLLFKVGYRLSHESTFPNWREGTEFKALRDSAMAELSE